MMKTTPFMFVVILAALLTASCGDNLYDSSYITSMVEHIGDERAAVDLKWTMQQHRIEGVVLAGIRPSHLYPDKPDTPENIQKINDTAFDLRKHHPNRFFVFPLIAENDPDPIKTLAAYLENGEGYGVSLDPLPDADLFTPTMQKFFAACEMARAPIILHVDGKTRYADIERLASDYPNSIFMLPEMAGLASDLPKLQSLLWRFNNLYFGFGFGPEDVLLKTVDDIKDNLPQLKKLILENDRRICFATETNLTEEPYRNSTLAEGQVRFLRQLLEKKKAKLAIKGRDGQWQRREIGGMNLDKQTLGLLYRLNVRRAISRTAPRLDVENMDLLLSDLPSGATFDPESKYRLVAAAVVNQSRIITRFSSLQVRQLLKGEATDFADLGGNPGPVELVSRGNIAELLAKRLKIDPAPKVRQIDSRAAFVKYMIDHPEAVGFCAFEDLDFQIRCMAVDGEAPPIPYIKYCSAKGAGTYAYYFDTYPLLVPVSMPKGTDAPRFNPHKIRRIILAGAGRLGPMTDAGKTDIRNVLRRTNYISPHLRDAGLTAIALDGPLEENCTKDSCTDSGYLPALLATGADAVLSRQKDIATLLSPHSIQVPAVGSPVVRDVRGMQVALVGGQVSGNDLPGLLEDIKSVSAAGHRIVAALGASAEDFDILAPKLMEAGVTAAVNLYTPEVKPWTISKTGVIAPGLGPVFVPGNSSEPSAVLVLTYYDDKFIQVEAVMVESREGMSREISGPALTKAFKKMTAAPSPEK